jgi:pSer/pThr/pTyr-binding forkhead associated (FHA) protein
MIICSHCGWENEDESVFCANCGRPIGRTTRVRAASGLQEKPSGRRSAFRALRAADETPEPAPQEPAEDPGATAVVNAVEPPTLLDFSIPGRLKPSAAPAELPDEGSGAAPEQAAPPPRGRSSVDLGEVAQSIREAAANDERPPALSGRVAVPTDSMHDRAESEPAAVPDVDADESAAVAGERSLDEEPEPIEVEVTGGGDTDTYQAIATVVSMPAPAAPEPEGPSTDPGQQPPDGALLEPPPGPETEGQDLAGDPEAFDSVELVSASQDGDSVDVLVGDDAAALLDDGAIEAAPDDSVDDAPDLAGPAPDEAEAITEGLEGPVDDADAGDPEILESGEFEAIGSDVYPAADGSADEARPIPPPLPEVQARFLLRPLSTNLSDAHLVPVTDAGVTVGREATEDVDDPFLSPEHALFEVDGQGQLTVRDLRSFNGVWIRLKGEALVPEGDAFMVGHQVLRVAALGESCADYAADGTRAFGPTVEPGSVRLVQLAAGGIERDVYHVPPAGVRIGRHIADVVFTGDSFMSGTHAVVIPREGGVLLRDLSSRNGTWLRVEGVRALQVGDAVMLGQTVWRVGRPVD